MEKADSTERNCSMRQFERKKKAPKYDRLPGSKCFASHDADKLPLNLDVPYSCTKGPHQLLGILKNDNKTTEQYPAFLGGETMFSMEQFERIVGASNSFLGWGGEDDDLWQRVQMARLKVVTSDKNKDQFYEGNSKHFRDVNPDSEALLKRETKNRLCGEMDYDRLITLLDPE
ncbi:unnamed protein product [Rodentolepis nana]|uniref:Glyco_transf_7C domain-containing protein n=1 Tax=Rodentolepis nana TaxID=102285 RepID=A0A0R3TXP3_RODNA|nr:unnamed protein product [Rodentolepis nana]